MCSILKAIPAEEDSQHHFIELKTIDKVYFVYFTEKNWWAALHHYAEDGTGLEEYKQLSSVPYSNGKYLVKKTKKKLLVRKYYNNWVINF